MQLLRLSRGCGGTGWMLRAVHKHRLVRSFALTLLSNVAWPIRIAMRLSSSHRLLWLSATGLRLQMGN